MRIATLSLLFALILFSSSPIAVHADSIIHTVQAGENLFRIGLKYGVGWQEIVAANGLTSTYIYVGQQLQIPNGGSAASVAAAPTVAAVVVAQPVATAAPVLAASHPGTYTVARGDTLGSISRKFGITLQALIAANRILNQDRIYYGQVLVIPGGTVVEAPVVEAMPIVAPLSKQIVVDISEQHMYVYENGEVVWSWVTSTGSRGRDTAPGNYSVLNKIPNAYGATWNLWMPHWLGIYWAGSLQNGIHALPILSDGSTLWAGWLGTPVSYGCVILSNENAATLYNWAEVGIPVIIQW